MGYIHRSVLHPISLADHSLRHRRQHYRCRLFGASFRHYDRYQQADFAGSRLAQARGGIRESHFGSTLVVINAPTAEFAARASADLATRLRAEPRFFRSVDDIEGSEFFARNGLLFRPTDDVASMAKGLGQAAPLIGTLASDPSLRGMTRAL